MKNIEMTVMNNNNNEKRRMNNYNHNNVKIAHVINPFKCSPDNPSYLYYAQPITFESMNISKTTASQKGIDVSLYAINYPEDDSIIPPFFNKLPHLTTSTQTYFPDISDNKKLPIIQEIFDTVYNNIDADYIIFTNADIGVQRNFYKAVYILIHSTSLMAFSIHRRDNIPKFVYNKRLTCKDLSYIYCQIGEVHRGSDCFVIKKKLFPYIKMGKMFIGYPPWGITLVNILHKLVNNNNNNNKKYFRCLRQMYITFHLGKDKSHKKILPPLGVKNKELQIPILNYYNINKVVGTHKI